LRLFELVHGHYLLEHEEDEKMYQKRVSHTFLMEILKMGSAIDLKALRLEKERNKERWGN